MATLSADKVIPCFKGVKKRNLINQRNFRSRRQQYLAELEQRLQQYKREGVAATQEAQQAARHVLAENTVLRHIAMTRLKLDSQTLDNEISQFMKEQGLLGHHSQSAHGRQHTGSEDLHRLGVFARDQPFSMFSTSRHPVVAVLDQGGSRPALAPINETTPRGGDTVISVARMSSQHRRSHKVVVADYASNMAERDSEKQHVAATTSDTLSCDDAVAILCDLRAQADLELLREELGCAPSSRCSISHEVLFETLDRSI